MDSKVDSDFQQNLGDLKTIQKEFQLFEAHIEHLKARQKKVQNLVQQERPGGDESEINISHIYEGEWITRTHHA